MSKQKKSSSPAARERRKQQQFLDKGQSPLAAQILRVGSALSIEKIFCGISEDVDFLQLHMRAVMFREILNKYWNPSEAHEILTKTVELFETTLNKYQSGLTEIQPWIVQPDELQLIQDSMDIADDLQEHTTLRIQYNEYMNARKIVEERIGEINDSITGPVC